MYHRIQELKMAKKDAPEIIVVGAGAAGFSAALALADRGYKVILIEQHTLSSGASGRNPGRMGHGFHYIDLETAKMYLRASIQVQRTYPGYLVGGDDLPSGHFLRHGRYFITKDSDNAPQEILATYQGIQEEYQRLIAEDPANEVFGPPEQFFRILEPYEYADQVNMSNVAVGVETAERLFNWQNFADAIKTKILRHPNINLYEHTEVVDIERGELGEKRFILRAKQKKDGGTIKDVSFETDYFVNSTWQNIEQLNDKIGLRMVPGARTNRLKALLVVDLPASLKESHSMFFCMGQHGMFSNLGNGQGMITYAEVTNMDVFSGLNIDKKTNQLLKGEAAEKEIKEIESKMLQGIVKYIPDMIDAKPKEVKFGIVQTTGKLTLEALRDPSSGFHKRDYDGVREEQIGVVSNPAVKLFYFVRNGEKVVNLIEKQIEATKLINEYMYKLENQAIKEGVPITTEVKKAIRGYLERYTSSSVKDISLGEILNKALKMKTQVISSLTEGFFSNKLVLQSMNQNEKKDNEEDENLLNI